MLQKSQLQPAGEIPHPKRVDKGKCSGCDTPSPPAAWPSPAGRVHLLHGEMLEWGRHGVKVTWHVRRSGSSASSQVLHATAHLTCCVQPQQLERLSSFTPAPARVHGWFGGSLTFFCLTESSSSPGSPSRHGPCC